MTFCGLPMRDEIHDTMSRAYRATEFKHLFEAFGFTGHGLTEVRSGVP
jgi:hypothetical protein